MYDIYMRAHGHNTCSSPMAPSISRITRSLHINIDPHRRDRPPPVPHGATTTPGTIHVVFTLARTPVPITDRHYRRTRSWMFLYLPAHETRIDFFWKPRREWKSLPSIFFLLLLFPEPFSRRSTLTSLYSDVRSVQQTNYTYYYYYYCRYYDSGMPCCFIFYFTKIRFDYYCYTYYIQDPSVRLTTVTRFRNYCYHFCRRRRCRYYYYDYHRCYKTLRVL